MPSNAGSNGSVQGADFAEMLASDTRSWSDTDGAAPNGSQQPDCNRDDAPEKLACLKAHPNDDGERRHV